jgi:hypothetical protein
VSYYWPWFLWPETKKLVIPFLCIYLIASILSVHCVSPHRRSHKPRLINSRKIARWCQDWRFQVSLRRKSISGTYLIFITSLPEDEQTSKHGGGGRYNAILEFKRGANKKWERKIKNEKWKNEYKEKRKKYICVRKRKKCEYVK